MAQNPHHAGDIAVVRVLTRTGTWVVLHGACLTSTGAPRVAVIVEPAHHNRIYPLLMSAYGLTEREKEVTRLVLQGASTAQIAADLTVSAHTVQQHLKNIFGKTGVHSRRDLVGQIFFTHYEPRFRDNEARARHGKPLRGGPWPDAGLKADNAGTGPGRVRHRPEPCAGAVQGSLRRCRADRLLVMPVSSARLLPRPGLPGRQLACRIGPGCGARVPLAGVEAGRAWCHRGHWRGAQRVQEPARPAHGAAVVFGCPGAGELPAGKRDGGH